MTFEEKFHKYYRPSNFGSITRKQAGVIFRNYKLGHINVDANWLYKSMTNDFVCPTTDIYLKDAAEGLMMAVSALIDGDYSFAQEMIDKTYKSYEINYR